MSLLTIGSVAFDAIETPFGKTDKIIGGAATYIAFSASYFIKPIRLVAVVGDDFPKSKLEKMQHAGIDLEGLQIKEGEKSFFWQGKYHKNLNARDTLITELNVLGNFDPIIPDNYQNSKYVMLGNLSPKVQLTTLERLQQKPNLIALDTMNFWMDNALEDLLKVIEKIDVLIINDEEARQLSGDYHLKKAAQRILNMGPKHLVIKKGEHGALLFGKNHQVYSCPALLLDEVLDPTGAGDTFAGGFMGYLAQTEDVSFENMKKALVVGSSMASFCVEKFGIERLLELSSTEINKRMQAFVNLGQISMPKKFD